MSIVPINPSGGDDTTALQNAINSTAQANNTLQLTAGTFTTGPLTIPNNANIQLVANVTVNGTASYASNQSMLSIAATNVTISGAGASTCVFQMPRASYSTYQGSNIFYVVGASNVNISNVSGNSSVGDGLYVRQSVNVFVNNCVFNNNWRQGSSITGQVNHIHYTGCQFSNTNGSLPSAGIDIEPNGPGDFLLDIQITNCTSSNNNGDGILVSLQLMNSTSQPVSIHILGHTSTNDGGGVGTSGGWASYLGLNNGPPSTDVSNAPGYVLFENCTSVTPAYWGACGRFWASNGASLIFLNLTVTNPMVKGPEPDYTSSSGVAVARGGGGTVPLGNVHYINCNISATNGKLIHYFDFFDQSGLSVQSPVNVQFMPGTLSGATTPSPIGTLNGAGSGPIH